MVALVAATPHWSISWTEIELSVEPGNPPHGGEGELSLELIHILRKQKLEFKGLQCFWIASISVGLLIEGMVKKQKQ